MYIATAVTTRGRCRRATLGTVRSLKTCPRSKTCPSWSPSGRRASPSPGATSRSVCPTTPTNPWSSRCVRTMCNVHCLVYMIKYCVYSSLWSSRRMVTQRTFICTLLIQAPIEHSASASRLCYLCCCFCRARRLPSGLGASRTAMTFMRRGIRWCFTNMRPCPAGARKYPCSGECIILSIYAYYLVYILAACIR